MVRGYFEWLLYNGPERVDKDEVKEILFMNYYLCRYKIVPSAPKLFAAIRERIDFPWEIRRHDVTVGYEKEEA